ncbi:MAG: hypothetical protein K8I02_09870, partial [Candidatus Methylomirabilis sp.]|nr:hypothetical protein [Deltaproteobacteria bacterium]
SRNAPIGGASFARVRAHCAPNAASNARLAYMIEDLEHLSLAALRARFSELAAPDAAALTGPWRGAFIGPAWLRAVAPRGLALVGLRGWLGKEIAGEKGEAANLVRRGGALARVLPMRLSEAPSLWDGRPCARLSYPRGSPAHWPWVVDELRTLDARRLLGLSFLDLRLARRSPLPFLLVRAEASEAR